MDAQVAALSGALKGDFADRLTSLTPERFQGPEGWAKLNSAGGLAPVVRGQVLWAETGFQRLKVNSIAGSRLSGVWRQ